jgi:hypothetical protein
MRNSLRLLPRVKLDNFEEFSRHVGISGGPLHRTRVFRSTHLVGTSYSIVLPLKLRLVVELGREHADFIETNKGKLEGKNVLVC